jgi:hypothetical protein
MRALMKTVTVMIIAAVMSAVIIEAVEKQIV